MVLITLWVFVSVIIMDCVRLLVKRRRLFSSERILLRILSIFEAMELLPKSSQSNKTFLG